MLFQDVDIVNGMIREKVFDERLRAPKGGISIKGKEFKGGEFIPVLQKDRKRRKRKKR